ncbi:glycosyl transferase [Sphingobacterium sp. DK4209]|uniref:Glycosyl transferase n=1 Tax=Sphingobacterium zhuxiongii TaxID=2662364 RepID=A0A5Q0Q8A5_9SPHI|nr:MULTISPECIES: glycosyltransferase family protein [unclassified Sphingobacterium]MVZ66873.1 glycosyl transferase [Sphingobacterium sp. DK4209]QGA26205.1 glycosyl transferase [Sphingobacterium sp. dk4302]
MKILYAVQGTGNGHLTRAIDIIPCLQAHAQVDVLVSGIQADIQLPFEVKYRYHGLSFIFGKSGGVDLWKTFMSSTVRKFVKEVNSVPVEDYDLVINDFEPISAWGCYFKEKPCIGLSHQIGAFDPASPKPEETDMLGKFIMKNYAPSTSAYGFHFKSYASHIFTPVIRQSVRQLESIDKGHYTVYLPSYDDAHLIKQLTRFPDVKWEVFSKHNKRPFHQKNVSINPINSDAFVASMASSSGVLCGAGFETPAEALYLGKKLLVIPMKNQYEQHLNAASLEEIGVPVIKSLKKKYEYDIEAWLNAKSRVNVDYPDCTADIVEKIIKKHS